MSLIVYTGSMYSGKSSKMLQEVTRYADSSSGSIRPLIVNHSLDNRDPKSVVSSHSSLYKGLSDKVDVVAASKLAEVNVDRYTVIGIDECNFFTDLYDSVSKWLKQGKFIICAGLDGSYKMELFGDIYKLLPIADEFVKLRGICAVCTQELVDKHEVITPNNMVPAPFTDKIAGDPTKQIEIGGSDMYRPVCRKHHICSQGH